MNFVQWLSPGEELPSIPLNEGFNNGNLSVKYCDPVEYQKIMDSILDKSLNHGRCSFPGCGYHLGFTAIQNFKGLEEYVKDCVRNNIKVEYYCCHHVDKLRIQDGSQYTNFDDLYTAEYLARIRLRARTYRGFTWY